MATKQEYIDIEKSHLDNFAHLIPKYGKMCKKTIDLLAELGGLQVSTLAEHAMANVGGFNVVSEDRCDFDNGTDAKLVTVASWYSRPGGSETYYACVTGVCGKTGGLLVQVYERRQGRFYYFRIPRRAYRHITNPKNSIKIPFEADGTPRRKNRCRINYWRYEVSSFEAMVTGSEGVKWLNK